MKLLGVAEWSEKFATRMSYAFLFARIHSAAAMTSLVRAMPVSSMTSIETSFAASAAPAKPTAAPAATPATNVPWPRPSPGELLASELRLTSATMRPAKSSRSASMPESTIAIAGMLAA